MGSIFVNGVEFEVNDANVVIDHNQNRPEAELKVGMVVTVKGMIDDARKIGSASLVDFEDNLEGPVTSIDLAASTLTVLGQTVKISPTTIFEKTTDLTTLAVNNIVEVSGFPDATGAIVATRIELELAVPVASTPIELKGKVANLDTIAKTFMIGALTVNYSSAILKDFPAGGIANGQFVEVKGTFGQLIGSTLTATSIELEPGMEAAENELVEVEGIVMNFVTGTTTSTFTINGVNVSAANALLSGISNGVEAEVKGNFVGGVLVATEVKIEQENNIKLEGDVTAVNATAGTVILFGIPVTVTATTELKDDSSAQLRMFNLSNVGVGDHLEIVGFLDTVGNVIASKLERKNANARKIIQGPVTAASQVANTLTILGVTIDTANAQFEGINNAPTTPADFFGAVVLNKTVVKARGVTFSNNTLTATEVEFEELLQ